jgi:HD-like signal output (HDOD) protein
MRPEQKPALATESAPEQPQAIDRFIAELLADLKANRLELPTLPQVAIKLNKVVQDNRSNSKDVAKIISMDPALSARLIRVANSPLVRSHKKIDNMRWAVTRMGGNMVRNVVSSFLIKGFFKSNNKALHQRMTEIWNHSAHVAAISHVLATKFTNLPADELMLAGLIHDIGKLPILAKARTASSINTNMKALDMVLDKLHPALGKTILSTWNFPSYIIDVAAQHENISRDSKQLDHTDVVIVANLHSYMGTPRIKKVDWSSVIAMKKLNLEPENSIEILKEAHDEILEIQQILTA